MANYIDALDTLHIRYNGYADGSQQGDSRPVHVAIIARLAENRRLAEARGWTECALERMGRGDLHLAGVAPGGSGRTQVPDLSRGGA